jgi:fumarate hydratase class I
MKRAWEKVLFELISRTSADLPPDVERALVEARAAEEPETHAQWVLDTIISNIELSRDSQTPICQDTGTISFLFRVPTGFDTNMLASAARAAVSRATRRGALRHNTIDSVSGASYPTNIGHGSPILKFEQGARKRVEVKLMLKGGGCENVGRQYALPCAEIGADRDLEGVRRCVLDAACRAQGLGCAPGILGVAVGGDRAGGYDLAKSQFFRRLDDENPDRALAELEARLKEEVNGLGIGPMGLGGATTVLGVKVAALCRLPASFFVTVSYMCWACRRRGVVATAQGEPQRWFY